MPWPPLTDDSMADTAWEWLSALLVSPASCRGSILIFLSSWAFRDDMLISGNWSCPELLGVSVSPELHTERGNYSGIVTGITY